jgi:ribonucleoside-diphosphate reductase alpha chain
LSRSEKVTVLTDHQKDIFIDRYAAAGETDPDQMWKRVATAMADTQTQGLSFYQLLRDFAFVPGGRMLAGAGVGNEVTIYNCYVIPVETRIRRAKRNAGPFDKTVTGFGMKDAGSDSREAIFDTIGTMVDIMSRGGGVGINWSVLRPSGAHLSRVNGTSSGPVGWMQVASSAVGEVEQGGSRRGAAMFMIDDWHPDVLRFIDAKREAGKLTNANISVAISDEFMAAVKNDAMWYFGFPDTTDPHYNEEWDGDGTGWLLKGYGWKQYGEIKARDMWKQITDAAWASGEPGVVFLGRYNKQSTGYGIERLISVNPCGEQGLGAYSVCNLGSMNLAEFLTRDTYQDKDWLPKGKGLKVTERFGSWRFDWDRFGAYVAEATRFLDNAIDRNYYFLEDNKRQQMRLRRIGLGVMGLADALIALGLRYGSKEAIKFTEDVFLIMKLRAIEASCDQAAVKGRAPAWEDQMLERPYFAGLPESIREKIAKHGMRNLFLLTQAPTGTTSILANVNSGIEPLFALEWERNDRTGKHHVVAPAVMRFTNPAVTNPHVVVADQVTVEEHIAMQAAVQKHVDSSVSKTINAPHTQTAEECARAYQLAYDSGLKGLAYYRDGSRDVQVLSKPGTASLTIAANEEIIREYRDENKGLREQLETALGELADRADAKAARFDRPASLTGETQKVHTQAGTAYITVNRGEDGQPIEVFLNVGKAGSDVMELGEAMGRLISLGLRHGATLGGVANQLESIGGESKFSVSLPHAISKVLTSINAREKKAAKEAAKVEPEAVKPAVPAAAVRPLGKLCSNCHQFTVVREEGCFKCQSCGQSAC